MPDNPSGCCGAKVPCCNKNIPKILRATFSNISTCACMDGIVIPLVWDEMMQNWSGKATCTTCGACSATWILLCGGTSCSGFTLTITGGVCIAQSITLDPGCSCDDPNTHGVNLSFTAQLSGLTCCNSPPGDGTGTLRVKITP